MSEVGWWLALVFGGFVVPSWLLELVLGSLGVSMLWAMLVYIWNRLGRVRFDPSDWRMDFWKSTMPGFQILGDDNRASPNRAGMMECSFSVEILNCKKVNTTLHQVAGVFHLPGGSTHSAENYDPEAGRILESLHLPAKQPVSKELWIQIVVSNVGREVMVKLASTERVVFSMHAILRAGATESRATHRSQGAPGGGSGGNPPRRPG